MYSIMHYYYTNYYNYGIIIAQQMGGAARLIYTLYRNDVVIQNSKIRILSIRCEVTSQITCYLL